MIEEPVAQHTANQGQEEERGREGEDDQAGTWVSGAGDEENRIYKNFLRYCEERREEQRQNLRADEKRETLKSKLAEKKIIEEERKIKKKETKNRLEASWSTMGWATNLLSNNKKIWENEEL